MKRLSMLVFATLYGCGDAAPAPALSLDSGLYVQSLRAMMNLKSCEGVRGQSASEAELKRSQKLIAKAQDELNAVESLARSKGLEDDLEDGRISFENQIAEELHVACDPNERGASERAHKAIEKLRVLVVQLPTGG